MSSPAFEWIKQNNTFNTPGFNLDPRIGVDLSGNTYVCYFTDNAISGATNSGVYDVVILKLDGSGNTVWVKQPTSINTAGQETNPDIKVDTFGNSYITYSTTGTISDNSSSGYNDIVVLKLNTAGDIVWKKQSSALNTAAFDRSPSIDLDKDGNVYVAFYTDSTSSGQTSTGTYDIVVSKLSSSGDILWVKQNSSFNTYFWDTYPTMYIDNSGNINIACNFSIDQGYNGKDVAVFKLDTAGNLLYRTSFVLTSTPSHDGLPSIVSDSSGNIYVAYNSMGTISGGTSSGNSDIILIKLDTSGNIVWTQQSPNINTSLSEYDPKLTIDSSDNLYLAYYTEGGVSGGVNTGGYDIVMVKVNTNGDILWTYQSNSINTSQTEQTPDIAVDKNFNLYLTYYTGGTLESKTGVLDIAVAKFSQPTAPGSPTIVNANSADSSATISFTAPSSDGGSPITGYTATASPGGATVSGASSPLTLTGLTNGTQYTISVVATNNIGDSAPATTTVTPLFSNPGGGVVPCFFGNAPVLTAVGYRRMDRIRVGDRVMTPEGSEATVERVKVYQVEASKSTNPYIIPKGMYGSTKDLLISPDHRVVTDSGLIEAKNLGLQQDMREGLLTYYNIQLSGQTNMVVAGVAVESLAPVERVVMPRAVFEALVAKKYVNQSSEEIKKMISRTCRILKDGRIESPVIRK